MMEPGSLTIACADIGTVRENQEKTSFGWHSVHRLSSARTSRWRDGIGGNEVGEFIDTVVAAIGSGRLALGFECPLWVPVAELPTNLNRARCMDWVRVDGKRRSRSWSAPAGTVSLSVGLTQIAWILEKVKDEVGDCSPVFFDWKEFSKAEKGVFFWEALVSGGVSDPPEGPGRHVADARRALRKFVSCVERDSSGDPTPARCTGCKGPNCKDKVEARSLIGAALLWAGWSNDVSLLRRKCVVLRTTKGPIGQVKP